MRQHSIRGHAITNLISNLICATGLTFTMKLSDYSCLVSQKKCRVVGAMNGLRFL
jgi:hypothetical protein